MDRRGQGGDIREASSEGGSMAAAAVRCTRCILPDTYPGISFDERGVCRVCREFDAREQGIDWAARERKLRAILRRHRGRGRYDCAVPFSGGKDATYTLLLLKKRFGMNPLALHIDNGFADPATVAFARKAASELGVDFLSYAPARSLLHRVYAHALERTGDFCLACVALVSSSAMRLAEMHGIGLVAGGFDQRTEAPPPEFTYLDGACFRNVMKSRFDMREISALYTFPAWKRLFRVRYMNLPDFVRWDPAEINSQLENEFGIHRTLGDSRRDCLAGPVSDRIFRLRTGFGKHEYLYANLVRAGFLDRAEALDQLRRRGNELGEADVENLLALIGCDVSVLEGIREKNSRNFAGRAGFTRRLAARLRAILP
jgi:hypothetical protein